MKVIRYLLLMLAIIMTASVRGQYNPGNPAEPGRMYSLALRAIPSNAGSFNISTRTSQSPGAKVWLCAYNNGNYKFERWETTDGTVVSSDAQFHYTMPARNSVLVARYKYSPTSPDEPAAHKYSKVMLECSPAGSGYFNISSGNKYEVGSSVNLRAYNNSNYKFVNWTENGTVISTEQSLNYEVKENDSKLVANFAYSPSNPQEPSVAPIYHKLTVKSNPAEGGYFNVSGTNRYAEGSTVSLYAYSNTSYIFNNWTLDGKVISTDYHLNYTIPNKDVTLTANYSYNPSNPDEPAHSSDRYHLYGMRVNVVSGQNVGYPVYLENVPDVNGFSIDVAFPKGFNVNAKGATLTERASGQTMEIIEVGDNAFRFIARGTEAFKGANGKILEIPVVVPDTVTVGNSFAVTLSKGAVFKTDGSQTPVATHTGSFKINQRPDELPDSPDLVVKDIKADKTDVMPGDMLSIAWKVGNTGNLNATGGWSERVSLVSENGKKISLGTFYYETKSLAVGESVSRQADIALSSLLGIDGKVKVSVTVIPSSYAGEAVEFQENNTSETDNYPLNVGKRLYIQMPEGTLTEGTATTVRCKLERSGNWNESETYKLTKMKGDDRIVVPASVTIPRNQSGAYFYLNVSDNDVLDADSVFTVEASGNGYASVAGSLTIEDDEYPQIDVKASKTDITEGETFQLTVTLPRASSRDVTVNITSEQPKRFTHPASVTVAAGETSATVDVTAVENDEVELQTSVAFKISAEKYQNGECLIMLNDNDLPAIDLELSPLTVSESAGPAAIVAKLRRLTNKDKRVTIQLSDDSNGDIYYSNSSIVLEKGVEELQFSIGVIDNAIVDGDRQVNITAAVYVSSCSCSAAGNSAGVVTKTIGIVDDDGPSLGVVSSQSTLLEGNEDGITLTITRNTDTSKALTVNISSNYDDGLSYDHSVTIPAGEKSVNVKVKALANSASGDDRTIVFTVESDNFSKGTCWVMLTDQTLADAQISEITVSKSDAEVGSDIDVSVTISNVGAAVLPEVTKTGVYISNSSSPVTYMYTQQALAPGEQVTLSKTVTLPGTVGTYDIYAVVNDGNEVKELLYVNNTSKKIAVKTVAPFSATVAVDKKIYQQGEKVTVSGKLTGNSTAGADVEVYVINDGLRQTIKTTSDADGSFAATFQPYSAQMGHFSVGACYPGEELKKDMASFDIYGFKRVSNAAITCDVLLGEPHNGKLSLSNPGVLPLTGVKATVVSKPDNYDVNITCPANIEGGSTIDVEYTITGKGISQGNDWEQVKIQFETSEGVSLASTLYCYCRNPKGQLTADISAINTTMVKGATRDYPITITNIGKGETGKITLSLPGWMSAATSAEMASLAPGASTTAVLRFIPTEDMQLNVPVTGTIGINCENGNGIPLSYSIEPVSESTGTLVVDVCDEYTYYTAEGPHVAGAQVLVKHPTTGAMVAQGQTNEKGLYSIELPEGYYAISVTADNHDSYKNNILVNPGNETKEVVNLSFKAISVDWKVEETEIEDEYKIVTTVKYETNVPAPVVELSVPSSIPAKELQVGESLIFYATLTNKGLITAQDVELKLPTGLKTLTFEALDHNGESFSILPQQSIVIPVKVTRIMNSSVTHIDDDPCVIQVGMVYSWDCGNDHKWHRYEVALQLGTCDSYDSSVWGGSYGSGSGSYGGGMGSISGPGGVGGGAGSAYSSSTDHNTVKREDKGCEPCQNLFMLDFTDCGSKLISTYKQLTNVLSCVQSVYDAYTVLQKTISEKDSNKKLSRYEVGGTVLEAISSCMSARGAGFGDKNLSGAKKSTDAVVSIITALEDISGKLTSERDKPQNEKEFGIDGVMVTLGSLAQSLSQLVGYDHAHLEELFCPLELLKPCDKDYPSYIKEFQKSVSLALLDEMVLLGIKDKFYGEVSWLSSEDKQIHTFLSNLNMSLSDNGIIKEELVPSLIACRPDNISESMARQFIERWNNTMLGVDNENVIDLDNAIGFMETLGCVDSFVTSLGYSSIDECYENEYYRCLEKLNEASNSVCASISLQLSQTMTMTRQAFRGTLTVFNGNEEKAMENVKLNLDVRDENGVVATSHEFQINAETLKGFTGNLDLTSGWSLAANETGVATILFIPTKNAALETDKKYSFGGTLTYVDPFTNLEVTRDLYPVSLTVKPSPTLDLTYFMQRDIYGDDPLTQDVIEPCRPAEFALVVNNKGYGDATNVKMVTNQPEIVENEKGLLIDFELLSSQLNGKDNTLALGGSIATDFGTIPARSTTYAQWWLQSSLLGHFTDYDVKATHVTSYGNEDLSLLDNVTIHELTHGFTVDGNAEPVTRGFLVNDIIDAEDMPDMVYFTDGRQEEHVAEASQTTMQRRNDTEYIVTVMPSDNGWNYGSAKDLTNGRQNLVSVVRQSDGAQMPVDNFWLTDRTLRDGKDPINENRLHLVVDVTGAETYLLTFEPRPETDLEVESFTGVPENGTVMTSQLKSVGVKFNKAIDAKTFTVDDITLNCQGQKVDISEAAITKVGDSEFIIGLDKVTLGNGYYVLTVQTAGITDTEGFNGKTGKDASWIQFVDGKVKLIVKASPTEGGSVSPVTGLVDYGSKITLKATPAEGYEFNGWKHGDDIVSEKTSYDCVMNGDEEFTALFAIKHFNIDIEYDATQGFVENAASGIYEYGKKLKMNAVPYDGYVFDSWMTGDEVLSNNASYEFTVKDNVVIKANFVEHNTGITSIGSKGISIYPLPLRDMVYVDGDFDVVDKLMIVGVDGSVKIQAAGLARGSAVDVTSLPQGIYIIKVTTDNGTYLKKVIKR